MPASSQMGEALGRHRQAIAHLAQSGDAQKLVSMLKQTGGVQQAAQAAAQGGRLPADGHDESADEHQGGGGAGGTPAPAGGGVRAVLMEERRRGGSDMGELEEKLNTILGGPGGHGPDHGPGPSPWASPIRPPLRQMGMRTAGSPAGSGPGRLPTPPPHRRPGAKILWPPSPPWTPGCSRWGCGCGRSTRGGDERTTDLLQALRPFLRKERQARLDRAVQLAKLSHVIRVALQVLGEKGEDRHV